MASYKLGYWGVLRVLSSRSTLRARLDEPTGLTRSMVALPQCRFRFARQNYCTAATTSGLKFLADPPQNSRE
jgi:hypothetical protein